MNKNSINTPSIETHTLPCGLRLVCAHRPGDVVYCGLAIDAGTRDELPTESGMAHFTEHMSFKGTHQRKAWNIINRMESVGGDLNAYTGKEETVYYCTFLRQHLRRAVDLLCDIVFCSTYPQREMDKEVEVVIDEIESYNDSPSELIFDEFEALLFQGHPLGRNILGNADRLRQLRSQDMQLYAQRLYQPGRMVLFAYGNIDMKDLLKAFPTEKLETRASDVTQPARIPFEANTVANTNKPIVQKRDTHQAHVMLGTRAYGGNDPRHMALYLINNILGGPGMNSRLNLALREKNGLVYTVESNLTTYCDTGVWSIYFGCDPEDVNRCLRLVKHELQRLIDAPLSESQLRAAKRQLVGQIGVSWDNGENVAIGMGKRLLHYNRTTTMQQLCLSVEALTADDLWRVAQEILQPDKLTTLIYK